jgi:hypothetical protein
MGTAKNTPSSRPFASHTTVRHHRVLAAHGSARCIKPLKWIESAPTNSGNITSTIRLYAIVNVTRNCFQLAVISEPLSIPFTTHYCLMHSLHPTSSMTWYSHLTHTSYLAYILVHLSCTPAATTGKTLTNSPSPAYCGGIRACTNAPAAINIANKL